jgi:O-antigen biosynthesis protein
MNPPDDLRSAFAALVEKHADLQRRFDRLHGLAMDLDARLQRVENSIVFRTLRRAGRAWSETRGKIGQRLLQSRLHRLFLRWIPSPPNPYPAWIGAVEAALPSAQQLREQSAGWSVRPVISVLVPVHQPRLEWLDLAIESVRNQVYAEWQLCLCLDGADPVVSEHLSAAADAESRIQVTVLDPPGGISAALNRAGTLARGQYLALLDQDDTLEPSALYYAAEAFQDRDIQVIYTDEDWMAATGAPLRPNLKPDWSPELLLSCMYLGHLLVVSRPAIERVGWFRPELDGAQDYDLVLRLDESGARFRHVPKVLYHWRSHGNSTAESAAAKPYAQEAGRRALAESLGRRCCPAEDVRDGSIPHTYSIRRSPTPAPGISFIIISRTARLVERCLESVEHTTRGMEREYVIVHHGDIPDRRMATVLRRFGSTVLPYTGTFNFAAMNNAATRQSRYPILMFLNDDIVALQEGWVQAMAGQALRPEVGIVGAKLRYPSGAIQHAGIVIGMGQGTGHAGRGLFRSDLWPWLDLTRDVSAVTGACMAVRRDVFRELGGFDERFPVNYNDVDLCLRARKAGYRVLIETAAVLRHDEARTRTPRTTLIERDLFQELWEGRLVDPFYSPSLDRRNETIALAPVDPRAGPMLAR